MQLMLQPLRDSYQLTFGDDVITTEVSNGMPRQRLGGVGAPHRSSVRFQNRLSEYNYLMAFWRVNRTKAFFMQLFSDNGELSWHECRFVSAPQVSEIGYHIYNCSFEIVIKPKPLNIDVDNVIVTINNMANNERDEYFNYLEKLVNNDLPNATRGLNGN